MLNSLRKSTEQLHRDLEKENIANKIVDHSIDLQEYKLLLFQNFLAYRAAEKEIGKYLKDFNSTKTEQLREDLKNAGIEEPQIELGFSCANEAEAFGAAYVVEGSAMGGMVIGKEIKDCNSLRDLPPQQFFNDKRDNVKSWNRYLKLIRSREFTKREENMASEKAIETFKLFQKAFEIENIKI